MSSEDIEKLRPGVVLQATGIVLEIGFGSGLNLPFYKNITKLYALEPSSELANMAKGRVGNVSFPVEFLNQKAENILLPDSSVDSVVSTWTFCSLSNPEQVVKEIKRVLRPNGKFMFIEHGSSPKSWVRFVQNSLTPITKHFTGNCHMNRNIPRIIENGGFSIENLEQFHKKFKPFFHYYQGVSSKDNF